MGGILPGPRAKGEPGECLATVGACLQAILRLTSYWTFDFARKQVPINGP